MSDQIPYVESGSYVAYNNEKGGVIESLREDGIVDLDSKLHAIPEWLSTKVMISTWLEEAIMYELWICSDGSSAKKIYYSDLPWPIGKILFFKQIRAVKQLLRITKDNTERREEEVSSFLLIFFRFWKHIFGISFIYAINRGSDASFSLFSLLETFEAFCMTCTLFLFDQWTDIHASNHGVWSFVNSVRGANIFL